MHLTDTILAIEVSNNRSRKAEIELSSKVQDEQLCARLCGNN